MSGRLSVVLGLLLAMSGNLWAGEILKLKVGNISTRDNKSIGDTEDWAQHHFFVVQWKTHISAGNIQMLGDLGITVLGYLPDDAYIVKGSAETLASLRADAQVQAILPYRAEWKADLGDPSLKNLLAEDLLDLQLVVFHGSEEQVKTRIRELPGVHFLLLDQRFGRLMANRSALDQLLQVEGIEWLEVAPEIQLNYFNPGYASPQPLTEPAITGYESGTKVMNFDSAWGRGWNGDGQIVAAADTGVDTGLVGSLHQDLGHVTSGQIFGMFSKGWNDPMGHGTHVVGSVLGDGRASQGLIRGGAFGAQVVAQGMWSPMLENLSVPSPLSKLFDKAYQAGARLHTNSWGSPRGLGSYDAFSVQVDQFMWDHPDMLIIFAAGNSGEDADNDGRIDENSVSNPGTAKNTLTVGASENLLLAGGIQRQIGELRGGKWKTEPIKSDLLSNNINGVAAFSSRGPTNDGRMKPEIVAPGTNIVSVRSRDPKAQLLWGEYNEHYLYSGGTSMATPLVAGAAAVVRQYLVVDRKIKDPSAALVKGVLMHTASDMFPGQFGEIGATAGQELLTRRPNSDEGFGRANLDVATSLGDRDLIVDEAKGLGLGEIREYVIEVQQSGTLEATLVYTDAPGSAAGSKALVNDLSLAIVGTAGSMARAQSSVNNHEYLQLKVEPGQYRVQVKGENIPSGKNGAQPFALIASVR